MMEVFAVDNIVCPRCEAVLDASAEACHRCGAPTAQRPSTASPLDPKVKRLIDRPWLIIIVLLHVGFFGIPLYWKTSYSLPVRLAIVAASIVYTVIAVLVIVWAGAQILHAVSVLWT